MLIRRYFVINIIKAVKYWITIILFLSVVILVSNAQDNAQWTQARQNFLQKGVSKDASERVGATNDLVNAMYAEVEEEAVNLIIQQLNNEIGLGSSTTKEVNVNNTVLDLCVKGLKKITKEKVIDNIIKIANNTTLNWRVRFYILKGMSGIAHPKIISSLVELLNDKDARIKMRVLDTLGELQVKEGINIACKLLNSEESWEVKIAASQYLAKLDDKSLIEPLIQVLEGKNLEGRPRAEVIEILKKLTGVDLGSQGSSWRQWWIKKNKGEDASSIKQTEETIAVLCYGIKETSKRIVFVLDISDSMSWGTDWVEEQESTKKPVPSPKFIGADGKPADDKLVKEFQIQKEQIDKRPVKKRIDAAKRELVNTIYNLDSSAYFSLVFYATQLKVWKDTLVPATIQNKILAVEEIDKQKPIPNGMTATFDALEKAYKIGDSKKSDSDKKNGVVDQMGGADTIFLVTDGVPTAGKIINRSDIIKEIEKINETRKIKINTIGVGALKGVPVELLSKYPSSSFLPDPQFLSELAGITGGAFVDKTTQ